MADSDNTIIFHRSILADGSLLILCIVLTIAGVWFTAEFPGSVQHVFLNRFSLPILLFALLPLTSWLYLFNRMFDCRYIIGDDYVRVINGEFSFSKRDMRIGCPHEWNPESQGKHDWECRLEMKTE